MKKFKKVLAVILTVAIVSIAFTACSAKKESTPVDIKNFRTTTYILSRDLVDISTTDTSHFDQITDFILFGCATFDEEGNVTLSEEFEPAYTNLKNELSKYENKKIYLNLLGPDAQTDSDDWNEQMKDKGNRHNNAFESGKLQDNIKAVLDKYEFNGVFFDYEFTMSHKNWNVFSDFLVSLDEKLTDTYEIGLALAGWDNKLSNKAKDAVDRVEVMSYDLWDEDGTHASYKIAEDDIKKFEKAGFDKSKLDLGLPFYARPTTQEGIWYTYNQYVDKIDEQGFAVDEENNLTASFNTPQVISQKTELAIDTGCGGTMIWHYSCDVPQDNEKSLFNSIYNTVQSRLNK